ncbi:hypothetical protein CRM22_007973 [Opisthorchis felineus]|uniref:SEA domain-containing protein n=1 Tax=Opisthorchis felineus TaxID=147828 RepID=A0A4S2LKD8_OPIFE|nr:hypothetical protein CRM22_007973 [Opisthorchis felineus]
MNTGGFFGVAMCIGLAMAAHPADSLPVSDTVNGQDPAEEEPSNDEPRQFAQKTQIVLGGSVMWEGAKVMWSPELDNSASETHQRLSESICTNLKKQLLEKMDHPKDPASCQIMFVNEEDSNVIIEINFEERVQIEFEELFKIFTPNVISNDAYFEEITHHQLGLHTFVPQELEYLLADTAEGHQEQSKK